MHRPGTRYWGKRGTKETRAQPCIFGHQTTPFTVGSTSSAYSANIIFAPPPSSQPASTCRLLSNCPCHGVILLANTYIHPERVEIHATSIATHPAPKNETPQAQLNSHYQRSGPQGPEVVICLSQTHYEAQHLITNKPLPRTASVAPAGSAPAQLDRNSHATRTCRRGTQCQ